jgi:hypothetical protein
MRSGVTIGGVPRGNACPTIASQSALLGHVRYRVDTTGVSAFSDASLLTCRGNRLGSQPPLCV